MPDFLQLAIRLGPVQLLQYAFQIAQLLGPQLQLPGQLLLGVFHPAVVLIEFGGVLLGGEDGAQGNVNFLHVLVVEVFTADGGLTLLNPMDVGGENISQLPQPLPVQGGRQLLFL